MSDALTIVHILRAPMGGVMRHVRDLALAHTASGHNVGIICDAPGTSGYNEAILSDLDQTLSLGVTRIAMKRSVGPSDLSAMRQISRIVNEFKPDVLHGHGAKGGLFSRRCGKGPVARFYSPHGGSLHYDPRKPAGILYFQVERWLETSTDHILFVADYERRTYERKIGQLKSPWTICYNGLADSEFEPVELTAAPADFLFIGEMRALKGPDMVLEGLKTLHNEGHDPTAIFVGAGPEKADYLALASSLGLQGHVEFRDPMPARDAFGLARMVAIPSRAEAMPYIVIEALAAAKPVITTSVGGIPEIFGDARDVLIEADTRSVADAMRAALLETEQFAARMPSGQALRNTFHVEEMARKVASAYRSCLPQSLSRSGTA